MTNCTKTGAKVYLNNYDCTVAADLFSVTPGIVVIHYNPNTLELRNIPNSEATYELAEFPSDGKFYFNKGNGTIVIPVEYLRKL